MLSTMDPNLAPVGDVPFIDEVKDSSISGQQIVTFVTEQAPDVESIPMPKDLSSDTLSIIQETRDHSIKEILCREYPVFDGEIIAGGSDNDVLFRINPLTQFLSRTNVIKKVSQFAILRTNLKLRIEFTAPPTVGGAVMCTFYPDLEYTAITSRLRSRLQRSQAPRQEILLSTVANFYMDIPWISPFYARNLVTGTGNIGEIVLSRIKPSNTSAVSYKVYVQCDPETLKIEYPTFNPISLSADDFRDFVYKLTQEQALALRHTRMHVDYKLKFSNLTIHQKEQILNCHVRINNRVYRVGNLFEENAVNLDLMSHQQLTTLFNGEIPNVDPEEWTLSEEILVEAYVPPLLQGKREVVQQEKKGKISGLLDAGARISTIASGVPIIGSVASVAAPILSVGSKIAGLLGFSKTIADKPIRPIRQKPADSHLTNEGVLPSHSFAVTGATTVDCPSGTFGTEMDEMATSYIERSTAIIGDFRVSTSTPVNQVVYAVPCTIAHYEGVNNEYYFTHQTWLANTVEKWLAKLIFDINFTGNSFHIAKLRVSFNPHDRGTFAVGDIMSFDALDSVRSKVISFGEDIPNNSIMIEEVSTTTMKLVPSTRNAAGQASIATYEANRYREECSYGMLYVTVEVPFKATSTIVAPYADFYVTFSTQDLVLSHPIAHLPFAPLLQGLRSTITEKSVKASRSERFELKSSDYLSGTAAGAKVGNYLLSCGDKIESIKNLLNAFYVFCPVISVQPSQSLMILPYASRRIQGQTTAQQYRHTDAVDYFMCGYGFYKGSMNIRVSNLVPGQPLGEINLQSPVNNFINASFSPALNHQLGYALSSTTALARSGSRAIPIFSEECVSDINIPYYSPFNISRVATSGLSEFEQGRLDNRLIIQPFTTQSYRIYRAVGDDFHLGTLTSLPPFGLDTLNILIP
ncbi:hypothetical protein 2 [Hubei picorna-like virus 18]|uniref:hypothetical protein 2 n=1 Tax=Hubei picorna-like virus 18 TaxID=1923097 RepID=UPI00090B1967|nr:hypothetical protein 2 [Hubei picorna-like virus 18]APG77977.1 hypothetical protein 2 [Hubei picorna-like virus 18]